MTQWEWNQFDMCYTARENVQNVCVLTNFKYKSKSANFGRFLWLDSTNQIDSFSIELEVLRHKFRVPRCLNLNKNVMNLRAFRNLKWLSQAIKGCSEFGFCRKKIVGIIFSHYFGLNKISWKCCPKIQSF